MNYICINYRIKQVGAVSSDWLERLRDMQEVTGSTPVPPNIGIL